MTARANDLVRGSAFRPKEFGYRCRVNESGSWTFPKSMLMSRGLRFIASRAVAARYAEADGIAPDLPRLTKPFRTQELSDAIADLGL